MPGREPTEPRELLLLASLLVFVAGICLQPMTESDLFFRIKVGAEIIQRGHLLGRNEFSFTAPDHPDLDLSWAFEVAVAALFRWGGFRAIVAAKTIWIVGTFGGLFALCRRGGAGPLSTTVSLALAAQVMRERFVERPHIVSFAGEVMVLAALASIAAPRPVWRRAVFGTAMGAILWANMHAGLFAGVMMCLLAGLAAWNLSPDPGKRRRRWRALGLAATLAVAASLTPVGPVGVGRYLYLHVSLPRLHTIDEFRHATWRSDAPFVIWVTALVLFGVGRAAFRRRHRPSLPPESPHFEAHLGDRPGVLLCAGMLLLGLLSVRFSADAALVSAPVMALALSVLARRAAGRTGTAPRWFPPRAGALVLAGTLLLVTAWPRVSESAAAGRPCCDVDLDTSVLPLDALRFVEANGLRERMYNDFEIGSYLLFQGYPRYRVFVDPRLPAYPEEMHRLLGSFDLERDGWSAAMDRYGVDSGLLAYAGLNRRVAWWDPDRWALVYRAADARVFVRRRQEWRALIAAHEIPATFTFTVEQGTATRPLEVKPAGSPVSDCEWQRRLGDLVFELDQGRTDRARAYFEGALKPAGCLAPEQEGTLAGWMGALELSGADGAHTFEHLNRALTLAPGDIRTRANRAIILERLGRRAEAAADWNLVATAARGTAVGDAAAVRARMLVP